MQELADSRLCPPAAIGDGPYRDGQFRNDSTISLHGSNGKRFNHFRSPGDDSDEDNDEVLPSANSTTFGDQQGSASEGVWRDGQWFNALDEQYLLPVFSNATASRRQATRKAMRSSARLTQHGNDSFLDENEPERDLTTISREGSRSPWDAPPSAENGGQDRANGQLGQGRNSRGFVNDHNQPTPSLSAAVSSLFSSMSPVSSSSWRVDQHSVDGFSPAARGDTTMLHNGPTLPVGSSASRREGNHGEEGECVQEIIVPEGSQRHSNSKASSPVISLSSFRSPKRRKSDDNIHQATQSDAAIATFSNRTRGHSSSASPLRETTSPRLSSHDARLFSTPASLVREEALQRRLSAPATRSISADGQETNVTHWQDGRSQSTAGQH